MKKNLLVLGVASLCSISVANAQLELDDKQNERLKNLEIGNGILKKQIMKLNERINKLSATPEVELSAEVKEEIKNIDEELGKISKSIEALNIAKNAGLDEGIVTLQMKELELKVSNLEEKKRSLASGAQEEKKEEESALTLETLLEVEYESAGDYSASSEGALSLAAIEFGVGYKVNDKTEVSAMLIYEDNAFDIEEANFTRSFGGDFYFTGGKKVTRFGKFESMMVNDTLTLEFGETIEAVLEVGYAANGLDVSVYTYKGDAFVTGQDKQIRTYGIGLDYEGEASGMSYSFGADYISNAADSDGITGAFDDETTTNTVEEPETASAVPGMSVDLMLSMNNFTFIAEYVAVTKAFETGELDHNSVGAKPSVMNFEFGYELEVASVPTSLAVGYQKTSQALPLGMPETRTAITTGFKFDDNYGLAIEYTMDKDYETTVGGTGEKKNSLLVQFAIEF